MNEFSDAAREQSESPDPRPEAEKPALVLHSRSAEETRGHGKVLGRLLVDGDVVLLSGELGAGKTAFTQGIGAGLGVAGTINSPTFTIVKEYDGRLPLHHFDLYRIEDPDELYALGFEECFGGAGVAVVEWAERGEDDGGGAAWPASWIRVELCATGPEERLIELSAAGERGHELLSAFTRAVRASNGTGKAANAGAPSLGERV